MPIHLTCSCGRPLPVADGLAGKSSRCPTCGALLQIPQRDAAATDSSASVQTGVNLEDLFGPGWAESITASPDESPAPLNESQKSGLKEDEGTKPTAVGCVLTVLTVAIIFGVAIPIVRWRDPVTGQPIPRLIAIFSPLLIGATVNGIAIMLLRLIGVQVWSRQEKDSKE